MGAILPPKGGLRCRRVCSAKKLILLRSEGTATELRTRAPQVWPYLLGHYALGSTDAERDARDGSARASYENTLSEWLAVEAIVRQRDKEASCLAKLSSESTTSEIPLIGAQP